MMAVDPYKVWANMRLKTWPERYWMLESKTPVRDRFGPSRVVSTDGELPFDVIGFLQPALKELNGQGIKAGPQCGAVFDHLFIYEKDIERAEQILERFIENAKDL